VSQKEGELQEIYGATGQEKRFINTTMLFNQDGGFL
jgi:hypothetical protein